jgi:hypothetical protein
MQSFLLHRLALYYKYDYDKSMFMNIELAKLDEIGQKTFKGYCSTPIHVGNDFTSQFDMETDVANYASPTVSSITHSALHTRFHVSLPISSFRRIS